MTLENLSSTPPNESLQLAPYAKVATRLLREVLYDEQKDLWEELAVHEVPVRQYFAKIGLELVKDEREGYAYLRQMEDEQGQVLMSLVRRRPLTYEQSLVCVLLREWLDEFDTSAEVSSRQLYITPKRFRVRVEMFFKEGNNQVKFIRELNTYLKQMEDMGFLKLVNKEAANEDDYLYEVRRIIKARVTADQLEHFKQQLEEDA